MYLSSNGILDLIVMFCCLWIYKWIRTILWISLWLRLFPHNNLFLDLYMLSTFLNTPTTSINIIPATRLSYT